MSRGPGKLQRAVFDVLIAAERPLKTAELFDELAAFNIIIEDGRKAALNSILRAAHGLRERGLVRMSYAPDGPVRKTCLWVVK